MKEQGHIAKYDRQGRTRSTDVRKDDRPEELGCGALRTRNCLELEIRSYIPLLRERKGSRGGVFGSNGWGTFFNQEDQTSTGGGARTKRGGRGLGK